MHPVRAAARLSGRGRLAAAALAVAAGVALALAVAGSGGPAARAPATRPHAAAAPAAVSRTQTKPPPVARVGGKALQSARCSQWRGASARQRDAVVATLHDVVGGPTPYGPASTLPADVAHQLFDRACKRRYAQGFLLYELYTRAAAFYSAPGRDL